MNELALFAGAGGGLLASRLLGWRTVCAVEIDKYCQQVLLQRQRDGHLEKFPIWDDVRTFDGTEWRRCVDIVTGGFPCQDISAAGTGDGLDGERSGLWHEMHRIISEVRPNFAFVENSPMLTIRGLHRVLGDLAEIGFDAEWGCLSAASQGAIHRRERIFILAYSASRRFTPIQIPDAKFRQGTQHSVVAGIRSTLISEQDFTTNYRTHDALAGWVDRLRAIGNGQVPAVVVRAWSELINP